MMASHGRRAGRSGRILRGLAALLTLIGLLAGVPVLLVAVAGNPLPRRIPRLDEISALLTAPDNGQLFLTALTVTAWAGWATFALSVLVEVPSQIRRRPTPRLPLLRPQQRLAASLIAAVALIGPAAAPVAAAATAAPPAAAAAAVDLAAPPQRTTLTAQAPAAGGSATYEVARADYLGGIAERFLGDFDRYPELARGNGITDPDHIEPKQQLRLPPGATDRGVQDHATGKIVTERPAPPGRPRPDAPGTTGTPRGAGGVPPPAPASDSPATPTPKPPPGSVGTAAPTPGRTGATVGAATAAPTVAPGPAPTDTPRPGEDDSLIDQLLPIGVPLLGAGLLAALLLRTLRRRRQRQEHHRPVGRRIPEPTSPEVETDLRVVAQPLAVDRLDHALRALAAALVDRPAEQMPDIVGAWLDGDTVNLLLTAACPKPAAPWQDDNLTWTLPATVELADADGQIAPLPTLVAVGSQPGMHLLLDLERLGVLAITGHHGRVVDLLRYLAAELACNAWSDHVEVTVAGFDAEETAQLIALGGDRIDAAPNISVAIERIRRRAGQVVQSLDHLDAGDPLTGRVADIAADAWMPQVLLIKDANPDQAAALERLDHDLAATGRCAVAAAVTANNPIGRWPISIDADGRLTIGFLGMTDTDATLTAAGLPRDQLQRLAELLTAARAGIGSASDAPRPATWPAVPPAPEPEPWAAGTDAAGGLLPPAPADHDEQQDDQSAHDDNERHGTQPDLPTQPDTPPSLDDANQPEKRPSTPESAPVNLPPAGPDASTPAVILAGRPPARRRPTTGPTRRRHSDPTLDADLRAWLDADPTRPRIAVLGPVTVDAPGQAPTERLRFYAEIIVYLAVRGARGVLTDQFDEAIWPGQQVKPTSRRVAVARARRWLGTTAEGDPWLPDATADRRYRLRDGYLLDWHLFRRLRARGENRGPAGGGDLRQALALVRGAPLTGADVAYSSAARNPYTWLPTSDIPPHHLTSAVIDTAHRLVQLCLDGGDTPGARWAAEQAGLADPDRTSDITWRDVLRVAAAEGNDAELDRLLDELMRIREAEVPEDLDTETYRLLCELLPGRMRARVS